MNAFDASRTTVIIGDSKIDDAFILNHGNMSFTLAPCQKGKSR